MAFLGKLRKNGYHTGTVVCVFIIVSLEYTKNDPSTLSNGIIKVEPQRLYIGKPKVGHNISISSNQ